MMMVIDSLVFFSVPTGYFAILNTTEYEFDVSVYSPPGTVVFEACIFLEDPGSIDLVDIARSGTQAAIDYLINGESSYVVNEPTEIISINITTNQSLMIRDDQFTLSVFIVRNMSGVPPLLLTPPLIIHIIGK